MVKAANGIYAQADETYRVQLLIGKTYDVMSTQPLSVVGRSDEAIEVFDVGPCSFSVVWPVTFTVGEGRYTARPLLGATLNDGGRSFHVLRDPPFLRGTTPWWGNCCSISGDGTNFTFACDNTCTCAGCMAYGYFTYSGYTLELPGWFECGCHYVEDRSDASVEISFDRSVALFEGTYTNAPGEVVTPVPSNVVLTCHAYGGTYGGQLSVEVETGGRIQKVGGDSLPVNVSLAAGEERTYEVIYHPIMVSEHENDVMATATLLENFTGSSYGDSTELTAVRLWVEAESSWPSNKTRHVFGPGEVAMIRQAPAEPTLYFAKILPNAGSVTEQGCLTAPRFPLNFTVEGALGDGEELISMQFTVVGPQSLRGENPQSLTVEDWDGLQRIRKIGLDDSYPLSADAPGVVMGCDVYVEPSYVNFSKINIYEGYAAPRNRQGCYENTFSYPDWMIEHGYSNGAVSNYLENACQVQDHNYVGYDTPGGWHSEQMWYSNGSYDLSIPIYWYCRPEIDDEGVWSFDPEPRLMTTVMQHVSIGSNGTMRVEKFGLSVENPLAHGE